MTGRSRWNRAQRAAALAALAAALAACSLLTGLDADYELKSTGIGSEGGPTTDGPAGDGDKPDGTTTTDGGTDGPEIDASTPRFCEAREAGLNGDDYFCADFEDAVADDAGLVTGWGGVTNDVGAEATIKVRDGAGYKGLSRGLEVDSNSATSAKRQTRLHIRFPPNKEANTYQGYELDFEARVLSTNFNYAALGLLVFKNFSAAPLREHGLAAYGPNPGELSTESPPGTPLLQNNPSNWQHVKVRLDRGDGGTFDRTIQIGSVTILGNVSNHVIDNGAITELRMGVFYTSMNAGRVQVQFDNVVFRRRP